MKYVGLLTGLAAASVLAASALGDVDEDVRALANCDTALRARTNLIGAAPDDVVSAIVAELQGDWDGRCPMGRRFAFELLALHGAADRPGGAEALVSGLRDQQTRDHGLRALGAARTKAAKRIAVEGVEAYLSRAQSESSGPGADERELALAFEALARLEEASDDSIAFAYQYLVQPTASREVRSAAVTLVVTTRPLDAQHVADLCLNSPYSGAVLNGFARAHQLAGGLEGTASDAFDGVILGVIEGGTPESALSAMRMVGSGIRPMKSSAPLSPREVQFRKSLREAVAKRRSSSDPEVEAVAAALERVLATG